MGKRKEGAARRLKMPDGQEVEFDAKGRVLLSRGTQHLFGFGLALCGFIAVAAPWMARSSTLSAAEVRRRQMSFVEATCAIVSASWGDPDEDGGRSVGLDYDVLVDGKKHRAGRYSPDGNYIASSIDVFSVERELRVGRVLPCWYDPADPTNALLVRATSPIGPPMDLGVAAGISAVGLLIVAGGIAMARSKKRWHVGEGE
jgi:hypothetical protein